MGMDRVVVTSPLAVQPQIYRLKPVAPRDPGTTPLRWLSINHVTNPAFACRQELLIHEFLHSRQIRGQLTLLTQLSSQLGGCIRTAMRRSHHLLTKGNQLFEQRIRQLAFENRTRKQIKNVQSRLWCYWSSCQRLSCATVQVGRAAPSRTKRLREVTGL